MNRTVQAALVVTDLPPSVGAILTQGVGEGQRRLLSQAILDNSQRSRRERHAAVVGFALELRTRTAGELSSLDRRGLGKLCRLFPQAGASLLSEWLGTESLRPMLRCSGCPQVFEAFADLVRHRLDDHQLTSELSLDGSFDPVAFAAILLMSLPPENSAQVFKELGIEEVQTITLAISKLPHLGPERRATILGHFEDGFGIDAFSLAQVDPQALALCLRGLLGPAPLVQVSMARGGSLSSREGNESQWKGVRAVVGEGLLPFVQEEENQRSMRILFGELQAAWNRDPMPLQIFCTGDRGYDLTLSRGERVLQRLTLGPEVAARGELFLRAIVAALAETAGEPGLALGQNSQEPPLSANGLAAIAAIQAFPPNALSHELNRLHSNDLARVAVGFVEFLSQPQGHLFRYLREAVQSTPEELLHQAGLDNGNRKGWEVTSTVASLLAVLPQGASLLEQIMPQLSRPEVVRLTDKLARLLYRHEDSELSSRAQYRAIAEFLEWQSSLYPTLTPYLGPPSEPGYARRLAQHVVWLWPHLTTETALQSLTKSSLSNPKGMADQLVRFLSSHKGHNGQAWTSGPVRAAQFLHTLNDPEPVRQLLLERGYPVPRFGVDLPTLRRARHEWDQARRAATAH